MRKVDVWTLLFFACILSLDALGAGFAYAVRAIRLPLLSYIFCGLASGAAVGTAVGGGRLLAGLLPLFWAKRLGGLLLFSLGVFWYLRGLTSEEKVFRLKIASLAVVVQILREPSCADLDSSGIISVREALLLGSVLSLDAVGVTFGLALTGTACLTVVFLVASCQLLFLFLGTRLGNWERLACLREKATLVAGTVFTILGLLNFFQVI